MYNFKEDLLHYIWKTKSFNIQKLRTTSGQVVTLIDVGHHNHNAGPDFLYGKMLINETLWHGHIELHIRSSDWLAHGHSSDPKYENVILHVVYQEDKVIKLSDHSVLPCIELKGRIDPKMMSNYYRLSNTNKWIPCEELIGSISSIVKISVLDQMTANRLTTRSVAILDELKLLNGDVLTLIYRRLARAFGFKVNGRAMHHLAQLIPLKYLLRHKNNLLALEAILFGCAGLLPRKCRHPYEEELKREYAFYKKKYRLRSLSPVEWKFSRMRPANFPSIRIAQFARFIHSVPRIDGFLEMDDLKEYAHALNVTLSGYWERHYRFGKSSKGGPKSMGSSSRDRIMVNAVVPLLFSLGRFYSNEWYKKNALEILQQTSPEENRIINKWKALGFSNENALESQGLLHLKKSFCDQYQCLKCPIGHKVMTKTYDSE